MITAYINYPNPHIRIHPETCSHIQQAKKPGQRFIRLELANLSDELAQFAGHRHAFSSTSDLNDMWLQVELNDLELEKAALGFVARRLGERYAPFRNVKVDECGRSSGP